MNTQVVVRTCALVTGGSRGIGRAICLALAAQPQEVAGRHILIGYLGQEAAAQETKALVEASGATAELLCFDVGDRNAINTVLGAWIENNPDSLIDVLVNNAGVRNDTLLMWMKDADWDNVLRTNLDSVFYITRLVSQKMIARRYGRIINVVSLSGIKGMAGQTNYSAAKAAVIGFTKALAQELGRRKITVNAVAPGFVATDMTAGIDEKQYHTLIPAGRFGTPAEVAHAVAFLASEGASYITGEVLSVNGGLYT